MKEYSVFRLIGSQRVAWRIVVDESDTVIFEGPSSLPVDAGKLSAVPRVPAVNNKTETPSSTDEPQHTIAPISQAGQDLLTRRGIKFHMEEGRVVIDHVPEKEHIIAKFLEHNMCPDNVSGCDQLAKMFQDEIARAGGKSCRACDLNKIRNKYRDILSQLLDASSATTDASV